VNRQIERARGCSKVALHTQRVVARFEPIPGFAYDAPSGDFLFRHACGGRRDDNVRLEMFAGEGHRRKTERIQAQRGCGRPPKANVSIGNSLLLRLPCGAPRCCLCSPCRRKSGDARTIPQGSEATASRTPDSRSVARPASPEVAAISRGSVLRRLPGRGWIARTESRASNAGPARCSWTPRVRSGVASRRKHLAEVSTSTATATFDSERSSGFGQRQ